MKGVISSSLWLFIQYVTSVDQILQRVVLTLKAALLLQYSCKEVISQQNWMVAQFACM